MNGAKWRAALGLGLLVATGGCSWTTTQVATLEPLQTTYPVSASRKYVDGKGNIVGEDDYQVVEPFELTRTETAARHAETQTRIALGPDLDSIMARTKGDAMTRVKIEAISSSGGGHYGASAGKYLGWTFTLLGAPMIGLAAILQANDEVRSSTKAEFWAVGAGTLGIGVLCFVLAAVSNDPATLNLRVSGQVVRRRPVAPPEVAPPEVAPPSADELPR